jgi:soluble lytic murein transglycosylase-like protein
MYELEIISAAVAAGISPSIALAVARRESGIKQFRPDGSVVTGTSGELGIFQVKPSTAPGVDLTDPSQNIKAGVGYLAQLYGQFGTWPLAVAAYNWGSGNVRRALAGALAVPTSVRNYVEGVLGPDQLDVTTAGKMTPAKVVVGAFVGAIVLLLVLR